MDSAHDPVREQLAQARRDQILDAATAVFAEKGFHRATTREIAQAAGVAEGTIYNYFAGKDDLLIALMARLIEMERVEEELTRALESDSSRSVVSMFSDRIARIVADHAVFQAVLPAVLTDPRLRQRLNDEFLAPATAFLEQYIRARIQRGEMRPVAVPVAARLVSCLAVGVLVLRMLGDETLVSAWDSLPEVLATIVVDGLAASGCLGLEPLPG
jgi:AcrR family transcriptional regulator